MWEPQAGSGPAGLHREWTAEPVSTGVSGAGGGRGTHLEGCGLAMGLRGMGVLWSKRTLRGVEGAGAESLRCAAQGGAEAGFGAEGAGTAKSSLKSAGRRIWLRGTSLERDAMGHEVLCLGRGGNCCGAGSSVEKRFLWGTG